MSTRKRRRIASGLLLLILGLSCACPFARGGHAPTILWVQDGHGQPLYWVNDKPCGRAPLSALEKASDSEPIARLTVILDSRVPIQEMAEIEGIAQKMDLNDVHYYVFDHSYPQLGMSEIIWKSRGIPLPASPPK